MATLRQVFTGGKMSKDVDERLLKKGQYRHALNIRIANSEGSDVGAIEKSLSNKKLTNLNIGNNIFTVGGVADEFEEKLYWLVKSELGCYIIEYNTLTNETFFVLQDTRKGKENLLQFDENHLITGIYIIIDSDNNNRFLVYTDDKTQPKCINIERAKTYDKNGFNEEMILLIKKPPIDAPEIEMKETTIKEENNIEEKFLRFAYRYKYLDGEYSAISPFTREAFEPKPFLYNYHSATNEGMINKSNRVEIIVNSGSKLVTDVEIIFKEDGKNIPYLVGIFNKKELGWGNNQECKAEFFNNKIYQTLPENQLYRLFDNVPLKAKAMDVIDNRIVFGNYTENFDITDENNNPIAVDLQLGYNSYKVKGKGFKSLKSNRDLEVAIAYLDEYGRMTTPLISNNKIGIIETSENNTTYIRPKHSQTKNVLQLKINNKPPSWAKYYRVFVKQSCNNYEVLLPTIYFRKESYVWVRIEKPDIDKVKEGDYLIVKSDKKGIKKELKKTKILEIRNIKENDNEFKNFVDKKFYGNYMKLPYEDFNINETSEKEIKELFVFSSSEGSGGKSIDNNQNQYFPPVFYGIGLSDIKVEGTYTANYETRMDIVIDSVDNPNYDTFKIIVPANNKENVEKIKTNKPFKIFGLDIIFDKHKGYSLGDKWTVSLKSSSNINISTNRDAFGYYGGIAGKIKGGSIVDFTHVESMDSDFSFNINKRVTKNYANLEEWAIGDDIISEIVEKGVPRNHIWFRRGKFVKEGSTYSFYLTSKDEGETYMIIQSLGHDNNGFFDEDAVVHSLSKIIIDGDNNLCFETEPTYENSDIFYEIGRTYLIENGLHLGSNKIECIEETEYEEVIENGNKIKREKHTTNDIGDTNQTANSPAILHLPFHNCYAWGNGFESIKIRDSFNANTLSIQTRPSAYVKDFRQNHRIASLTWGRQYDQTLNYNGLNEFNLSTLNFKDLDDKYGSIQTIMTYNTDLDVWQEDKVHKVLYGKSTLYNADGSSNVGKSNLIFDSVIPYSGEFGISKHPESLTYWGNYRYWIDRNRGVVLRKGQSGIEIISRNGMRDWFRDFLRENNTIMLGTFDPYYNQYTIGLRGNYKIDCLVFRDDTPMKTKELIEKTVLVQNPTLTFDEIVKGWTSFHSFVPDLMLRLNNRFYTIKNGQLYLHNEEGNGYNNFYGVQYPSEIITIFNDQHQMDKIHKTLFLEGTKPWRADFITNFTQGHLKRSEFNQRDSRWFSHLYKNENKRDLSGCAEGLGIVESKNGTTLKMTQVLHTVSVGDELWKVEVDTPELVGVIEDIKENYIVVNGSVDVGTFCFAKKNSRIEGEEIRGYFFKVKLSDDTNEKNELFAVNSEVVKSYL